MKRPKLKEYQIVEWSDFMNEYANHLEKQNAELLKALKELFIFHINTIDSSLYPEGVELIKKTEQVIKNAES